MTRVLVTGSSGHLGEGLVRTFRERGAEVLGLDAKPSPYTTHVGTVENADLVARCAVGVDVILHTATLHKPHLVTHSRREFVETNIQGTLSVLEAAVARRVAAVVFTSTTSVFGSALHPGDDEPAVWVTESLKPIPRNIYGVTKAAGEQLCELFHRSMGLPCIVLRTSRFFPESDDRAEVRARYSDLNAKVNEYLHRRVDLADVVAAHVLAAERAQAIGFGRYIVSATTPFAPHHAAVLRRDAPSVVRTLFPAYEEEYGRRGWRMLPSIDRVYVNTLARAELGWEPRFDFRCILGRLARGEDVFSALARAVGSKGYHDETFTDTPYPVDGGTRS